MSKTTRHRIREIGGVLLLFTAALLGLAMFTYHAEDASSAVSATVPQTHNAAGRLGAWLSDSLFHLLGAAAYLLIIPVVMAGARLLSGRPVAGVVRPVTGLFLLLLALAGLFDLGGVYMPGQVNFAPGGTLGRAIGHLSGSYLNTPGAVLLLMTAAIVGVLLATTRRLERLGAVLVAWPGWRAWRNWRSAPASARPPAAAPAPVVPPAPAVSPTRLVPGERSLPEERPLPENRPEPDLARSRPLTPPPRPVATGLPEPELARTRDPEPAPSGGKIPITRLELPPTPLHPAGPDSPPAPRPGGGPFPLPGVSLLNPATDTEPIGKGELMERAEQIVRKYAEFNVDGGIEAIHPGPVVTLFEFKPAPGVKYSRMLTLADDLCLGLKAESVRIDRIPGKSTVGIEVPNSQRQTIAIRELLESAEFKAARSPLTLALGKRINGDVFITDLTRMPHLLVAGATGQGKSVGLNTMITSILYRATPEEVKFILIDPKRVELGMYADLPHLLTPIVTEPKAAANVLIWAVGEMEERYRQLARYQVKDITNFNRLVRDTPELEHLPYIVIVIDELAELLSVASKEVELCLQRLAQMARAVGIHIIMATQRPSVEVVTGVIKANFPSRISFRLMTKHDSKTILDSGGADQLLGMGDMLILPPNTAQLIRVHGAYISGEETQRLVEYLRGFGQPEYRDLTPPDTPDVPGEAPLADDPLYDDVARFVVGQGKASTSILQRRFRIGYGRAARLMDLLEENGIIGEASGSRPRDVLVNPGYFDEIDRNRLE